MIVSAYKMHRMYKMLWPKRVCFEQFHSSVVNLSAPSLTKLTSDQEIYFKLTIDQRIFLQTLMRDSTPLWNSCPLSSSYSSQYPYPVFSWSSWSSYANITSEPFFEIIAPNAWFLLNQIHRVILTGPPNFEDKKEIGSIRKLKLLLP